MVPTLTSRPSHVSILPRHPRDETRLITRLHVPTNTWVMPLCGRHLRCLSPFFSSGSCAWHVSRRSRQLLGDGCRWLLVRGRCSRFTGVACGGGAALICRGARLAQAVKALPRVPRSRENRRRRVHLDVVELDLLLFEEEELVLLVARVHAVWRGGHRGVRSTGGSGCFVRHHEEARERPTIHRPPGRCGGDLWPCCHSRVLGAFSARADNAPCSAHKRKCRQTITFRATTYSSRRKSSCTVRRMIGERQMGRRHVARAVAPSRVGPRARHARARTPERRASGRAPGVRRVAYRRTSVRRPLGSLPTRCAGGKPPGAAVAPWPVGRCRSAVSRRGQQRAVTPNRVPTYGLGCFRSTRRRHNWAWRQLSRAPRCAASASSCERRCSAHGGRLVGSAQEASENYSISTSGDCRRAARHSSRPRPTVATPPSTTTSSSGDPATPPVAAGNDDVVSEHRVPAAAPGVALGRRGCVRASHGGRSPRNASVGRARHAVSGWRWKAHAQMQRTKRQTTRTR